jgi:hypothetical protein
LGGNFGRVRFLAAPLLALALALSLSAASSAQAATLLYPNLRTLPPRDLRFDRADVDPAGGGDMHNVLRFSNTVWNSGPGRLEMRGTIDPQTHTGGAVQRVYDDSGGYTDFAAGSFYYHPVHDHYHYDDWGRYELWTRAGYEAWLASGRTEGSPMLGSKTTSCMIDEEFIRNIPNQPYPPIYGTGGCFPDSEGDMLQGISPGWGDTYDYFRFEQWIDLGAEGSLSDGQYVLRSVADPLNKIYESAGKADPSRESQEDNEAITEFTVSGGKLLDSNPPSGSVRINDIDVSTSSPNVIVKVLGRDDVSDVTEVRLSNDGSSWSAPAPYTSHESEAQAIDWDLIDPAYGGTDTDGTKTVYAEFRDASGKWSEPESDTIVLDRSGNSSPYSNAVLSDGPSGYWRLGETEGTTASDEAGTNPGAYENAPALGQPSLLPADPGNGAVGFDGSDDYVDVHSAGPISPTTAVSVEAWIEPAALPAEGEFASVASKPGSYSLQFSGPRLEFKIDQPGGSRRLQAPPGAIEAGHAYYVVGTFDGTTQRLYIEGDEVAEAAQPEEGISNPGDDLRIGSWDGAGEFFEGEIDEVAVYTSALSAARIDAHHQAGVVGTPPDTTVDAPSGLSAAAVSDSEIDLHWTDNSDNEGEFRIERDTSPDFGSPVVAATWADSTSYADIELSPGTTYYYRVRARNATDSSGYSNTASATTPTPAVGETVPQPVFPPPPVPPISPSAPQGYAAAVMEDRPVSYWRLDELSGRRAHDARGANPGLYRDDPRLGRPSLLSTDPHDGAVGLDGAGDYIRVPASRSLSPGDRVSVEAWIRPARLPGRRGFALLAGAMDSYSIQLDGRRPAFTISEGHRRSRLLARPGLIEAGRTYHVVGTYDGTSQRLFIDGVDVASAPVAGSIARRKDSLDIGSDGGSRGSFMGTIDEVAVYARALAPERVRAHYRAGVGPGVPHRLRTSTSR